MLAIHNKRKYLPVIFGLEGERLSDAEHHLFVNHKPYGFILFRRNISSMAQLKDLTQSLKDIVDDEDCPILIDQEGGRVQRLITPPWPQWPALGYFGDLYDQASHDQARQDSLQLCYESHLMMAQSLKAVGINMNCAPVLDLRHEGAHDIIGDRAISKHIQTVIALAQEVIRAHQDVGITPIIKHIPGHGRAKQDSHKTLPIIDTAKERLKTSDFMPFKAFGDAPFAMSAHILYKDIDPDYPATLSKKMIGDVVRGELGYRGCLISDDICMKALSGSVQEIAKQALNAGIDIILHCNGQLKEMEAIIKALSET